MHTPPNTPRGKLLSQYVLARVTKLDGIDLSRFSFDTHNTIYYFIINADQHIYLRYGGRDSSSPDTYLNLKSLELALRQGLDEHKKYQQKKHTSKAGHTPTYPEQYHFLKREVITHSRCVECHLTADYTAQEKYHAGILNPLRDLYRSPDIKKLGIHLDVPHGLRLAKATGAAQHAGIRPGDMITAINGVSIITFADLQYQLDQVPRHHKAISLTIKRDTKLTNHQLHLPDEWWKTDLSHRYWSLESRVYLTTEELTTEERKAHRISPDSFAAKVKNVGIEAIVNQTHTLKPGDIITAVNGISSNPLTRDLKTHIKITYPPHTTLKLNIIRDKKAQQTTLITGQEYFRKAEMDPPAPGLFPVWTKPQLIKHTGQTAATIRATVTNNHLIVQLHHTPGWHSKRHMLETKNLQVKGNWLATAEIPHKSISYFAISLAKLPQKTSHVTLKASFAHDDNSSSKDQSIHLTIPAGKHPSRQVIPITKLLETLQPVNPGNG